MEQYSGSIILLLLFVLAVFIYSQVKFKNKMLCYFIRPNKTRIKKFVPIYYQHVELNRGKYGKEVYRIDWKHVTHEYYTGGINRIFPFWIPTFEYYHNNPNPVDPTTGQPSWHTPEVEYAAYQGQSYVGIARAMAAQSGGGKRNRLMELLPLITIGLLIIVGFLVWQGMGGINEQVNALQQQINLGK